jgi:hypothetical protein
VVNQQRGHQKGPAPRAGHANYTTMEEIPTGEEVLVGTFFLNEHPVIILFNSGASHDCITSTCAKKAMLSIVTAEALYVISTPRGRVDADWIVRKAPLELAGRVFSTDLIIQKGQGIDVILGMSWMKLHRAILDIAGRLVHLDSPVYGQVILHLPASSRIKASLHHVVVLKLEDIHIIREFSDMFLDDLPRMPPGNEGVEDSTARFAGQRIYPPKYITLGLFGIVCREEGQRVVSMCGLSTAKCSRHQEQVSTPTLELKCSPRLISTLAITKLRFVPKIYPRRLSQRGMVCMSILSCRLD